MRLGFAHIVGLLCLAFLYQNCGVDSQNFAKKFETRKLLNGETGGTTGGTGSGAIPPPAPTPTPTPEPQPPEAQWGDGGWLYCSTTKATTPPSMSQITWIDDVSDWDQTSQITDVNISTSNICIEHTKSGRWPVEPDNGEGNPWVIAYIDGKWYAATYEWLRPGQTCKSITALNIGAHTKREPLKTWMPCKGDLVGFMVSTYARFGARGEVQERSDIEWVIWPY